MVIKLYPWKKNGECCDKCGPPGDPCNCEERYCYWTWQIYVECEYEGAPFWAVVGTSPPAAPSLANAMRICQAEDPPGMAGIWEFTGPCNATTWVGGISGFPYGGSAHSCTYDTDCPEDSGGIGVPPVPALPDPIEQCCETYKWYCVLAQLCDSGDCTTACSSPPVEMCLGLTPAQVAAVPLCVGMGIPGGPGGVGSIYISSVVNGPHDTQFDCSNVCPPWYCVKYTEYPDYNCMGAPTGAYTTCEQLLTTQLPGPGGMCLGYTLMEVISGPYEHEYECEALCEQCCNFNTVYAGKKAVFSSTEFSTLGPQGQKLYASFTGNHTAGGSFTGTWTVTSYQCGRTDIMNCGDEFTDCAKDYEFSGPATLQMFCSTDEFGIYYYFTITTGSVVFQSAPKRDWALSNNCGYPVTCVNVPESFWAYITECSATYSDTCLSVSGSRDYCESAYVASDCPPEWLFERNWAQDDWSLSIVPI